MRERERDGEKEREKESGVQYGLTLYGKEREKLRERKK